MWKFQKVPEGYWDDGENVLAFVKWLEVKLDIKDKSDWYHISTTQLNQFGGSFLLQKFGSVINLLRNCYPTQKMGRLTLHSIHWQSAIFDS